MVTHFYFFPIEKALKTKGFWQQGVQIEPLAAKIFLRSDENRDIHFPNLSPL